MHHPPNQRVSSLSDAITAIDVSCVVNRVARRESIKVMSPDMHPETTNKPRQKPRQSNLSEAVDAILLVVLWCSLRHMQRRFNLTESTQVDL